MKTVHPTENDSSEQNSLGEHIVSLEGELVLLFFLFVDLPQRCVLLPPHILFELLPPFVPVLEREPGKLC